MNITGWTWANLDRQQLEDLKEAERTLGARILLAYESDGQSKIQGNLFLQNDLKIAPLSASQVECLQGVEKKLGSVVVAYQ